MPRSTTCLISMLMLTLGLALGPMASGVLAHLPPWLEGHVGVARGLEPGDPAAQAHQQDPCPLIIEVKDAGGQATVAGVELRLTYEGDTAPMCHKTDAAGRIALLGVGTRRVVVAVRRLKGSVWIESPGGGLVLSSPWHAVATVGPGGKNEVATITLPKDAVRSEVR